MKIIKKHILLIINVSLIIVILLGVLYIKNTYSESKKNFTEIKDYSQGLVNDDSDISFTNVTGDNFELYINKKLFHKGNTLSSFRDKLKEIEVENGNKKIYVNIYNDNESIKTEVLKYKDFGYSLNRTPILNLVKRGIIDSKGKIDIKLKDYVFIDDKLLNKKVNNIKESFTEDKNGEIYYSDETKSFKVNTSKFYLTSIKEIKLNLAKVDENINLKDSAIDIYLSQEENKYFKQVEKLNKIVSVLSEKTIDIQQPIEGIDYSKLKNNINSISIKELYLNKDNKNFQLMFNKGILANFIKYNKENNTIELDDSKFDGKFIKLNNFIINTISDELTEKATIYNIKNGGITENIPSENDFTILTYGNGYKFDYQGFKKEIKLYLTKLNKDENSSNTLILSGLFIKNTDGYNSKINIKNNDSNLVDKSKFELNKGLYKNGEIVKEKYINYGKYNFTFNDNSQYNSCTVKNNLELFCEDGNIFMGKLGYNGNSIILKEPNSNLYEIANEKEYGLIKKSGNLIFSRDNIILYYGNLYNNIKLNNLSDRIIQDYKKELFPSFMWDNINGIIENDKVIFKFVSNDKNNKLLIKSDDYIENYYVYLFYLELHEK